MRSSIRVQFAAIFIALMALTLSACWVVNNFFLESFYMEWKQEALMEVYNYLNTAFDWDAIEQQTEIIGDTVTEDIEGYSLDPSGKNNERNTIKAPKRAELLGDSAEFISMEDNELSRLCARYNISFLILGTNGNVLKASMYNVSFLRRQLFDNIFDMTSGEAYEGNLLAYEDGYIMRSYSDRMSHSDFMEMWGFLSGGKLFILRTPRESITVAARLANNFLGRIGIAAIIIGAIFIFLVTSRITDPIRQLTRISERMTKLDFDTKYTLSINNEVGLLGENMNVLSKTLEKTISELKTANLELQKDVEKKEQIDNMRREFLSNVSHELKTPIALIQGYAEGLKDCVNEDDGSRDFYCDVIMDEASRMNRLVQNLLNLDHLESGSEAPLMEHFDVAEMLNNIVQASEILFKQHGVFVKNDIPDHLYVWSDRLRCEEVIRNYVSNALNHCDNEKTIHIKACKEEDHVRISVFNTGTPIPEESLSHIWEKFYKVDKARTREYGGSGVGLSIVKAACESVGQKYGAKNYDNGVEFWFTVAIE